MATPVDVSLWVRAYTSAPTTSSSEGWSPGSPRTTVGSPRWGAADAASANFDENSPNTAWALTRSINENVAASQNRVEPPLPSRISQPSGRPNRSTSPLRTEPTRFLTGACRCDVPSRFWFAFARASACSGRTFDGPHPKRPSTGNRARGISMVFGSMLTGPVCPATWPGQSPLDDSYMSGEGQFRWNGSSIPMGAVEAEVRPFRRCPVGRIEAREPNLCTSRRHRRIRHPGRRRQGQGAQGQGRERHRLRRR